jgi:hypothetical protein
MMLVMRSSFADSGVKRRLPFYHRFIIAEKPPQKSPKTTKKLISYRQHYGAAGKKTI